LPTGRFGSTRADRERLDRKNKIGAFRVTGNLCDSVTELVNRVGRSPRRVAVEAVRAVTTRFSFMIFVSTFAAIWLLSSSTVTATFSATIFACNAVCR
jgi:hypothetical protein